MTTLDSLQWVCAALGALMVGMSKTAISGLSVLAVALFAFSFASGKQASGLVLPLLVFGDFVAVFAYRRHAQWQYLWKLFPWTALGVVLGFFALGRLSDRGAKSLIGVIILALAAWSYWRRYRRAQVPSVADPSEPIHWSVAIFVGILAGFVTLIANAAGPLMAIYLVSMRLPKMQYVGTGAVFFLLLNLFKVPFMAKLGLITIDSFKLNLMLLPAVLLGAWAGRWLLKQINQPLFENLVLALSGLAGMLLLV